MPRSAASTPRRRALDRAGDAFHGTPMPMRAVTTALAALTLACAAPSRPTPSPAQLGQQPAAPDVAAPVDAATVGVPARSGAAASTDPAAAAADPATPVLLGEAKGDGLLVSTRHGIELLGADLERLALLTPERGRHLRLAGDQLYYFELRKPVLRALDLNSGQTRVVARVPLLHDDCFGSGRPVDPIAFVQGSADLALADGALCLDITDHVGEVASETFNYRIDVTTGTVERRMISLLGGGLCGKEKEREQPRLCTPGGEGKLREQRAPSGRWVYFADGSRGERSDRVYALATLADREARQNYAVVGRKLRALPAGGDRPVGACLVPVDASAQWFAASDVLLLEGCRDRLAIVRPPGRVDYLAVDGFAALQGARAGK